MNERELTRHIYNNIDNIKYEYVGISQNNHAMQIKINNKTFIISVVEVCVR